MNEDDFVSKQRQRPGAARQSMAQYTVKDFQLEVLGKLEETEARVEALQGLWRNDAKTSKEERLLRFDGRTLVAIGAIALSLTGYVLQDARSKSRQEAEIATTKARVNRLEQIAEANTEGRIRMEVQLEELREGQLEIKRLIGTRDKVQTGETGIDRRKSGARRMDNGP